MTSSVPLQIIADNDDEFDWEAAVREIDVACQNANPSSTVSSVPKNSSSDFAPPRPDFVFSSSLDNKKNADKKRHAVNCKQSTLNRFFGNPKIDVETGGRCRDGDDDVDGDERATFVGIDAEAAKTWIYPVNVPLRDYQFAISKTALFSNTLVALPTGLGKTLIAAVVMYNYFRWFPDGKIVFAAPSRPLVMQQIEACHNIVGIPQEWTIDMTGQITPSRRACFWKTKRVFFVTPQVLEKDIQSGTCLVRYLVCLVIDEAHRALGNYSYCVAVRELMAASLQLRILALTATPGSKQPAIQNIIDNLHISTLEYRNESDPDVSPYVQNRKIELIQVPLGRDAVDINQRLSEVIRPYVARLYAIGLLQNRDYQTLSPPDLLNSRDRFRRAPPPDLPQSKYGEIEAYFAGLITLYHIRKLLSSHGVKPAYEMLEEKLKQGPFARLMSKNEDIRKVKLLMQQSLSHGAPSPKLSKMLEILIEHLRTKDLQNSRIIIFSNFRGSVRDIMDALANVGDLVRATEFIGQSSGKALKGQSQKVQQAVLQKFRAGGYNVIVATSIGEEGLDIMEVDLVICFDANVSPLRMIQRMGRTGRKHDGRVVVLACEGSELKGYMRKQASSRAIKKHMHNGGINSFNFHSSPRMIPHIFKPEVQFVEMSIDRFIPRGKKVKDDTAIQTPVFKEKLTVAETDLLAKYFQRTIGDAWRPSLIAFPRFQAFPSRVHKVMHSHRTDMLIDAMQHLQGLSFSKDSGTFNVQDEVHSGGCLLVNVTGKEDNSEDLLIWDDSPRASSQKTAATSEVSPVRVVGSENKNKIPDLGGQNRPTHSFLFGSDFVSVDAVGKVLILSVPLFPSKEASNSKCTSPSTAEMKNGLRHNFGHLENSGEILQEATMQLKDALDVTTTQRPLKNYVSLAASMISSPNVYSEKPLDWVGAIPMAPILNRNQVNEADCPSEAFDPLGIKASWVQADECSNNLGDSELSPRLTNMIQTGVVPESPIRDGGPCSKITVSLAPKLVQPEEFGPELMLNPPRISGTAVEGSPYQRNANVSLAYEEIQTPLLKVKDIIENVGRSKISPMADKNRSPMANSTRSSCSRDWVLSSGGKSESAKPARKFKRLRKLGDIRKNRNLKSLKENSSAPIATFERPPIAFPKQSKQRKGKRKQVDNVRVFIDEEAEVSSEAEISGDEEDDQDRSSDDSFMDSFIDDRINPTVGSTQAEASKVDMMAVYRRSLLSQSPMEKESSASATVTPDCRDHVNRTDESGSSLVKTSYSLRTPQTESTDQSARQDSESLQMNSEMISAGIGSATADFPSKKETILEVRKRKLSFCQSGPIPVINLQKEFSLQLKVSGRDSFEQGAGNQSGANGDAYHDDQFFEGLDLDAVEAQAALLLKKRSDMDIQKQDTIPKSHAQNIDLYSSPSFDLGI